MIDGQITKNILIPLQIISLAEKIPLRGKIRLQKLVFLTQEKSKRKFDYDFEPAPLGPLSEVLNTSIATMKELGFIEEAVEMTRSGNDVYCYSITEFGLDFLKFGIKSGLLLPEIKKASDAVFKEYGRMPYVQLLDFVHDEYPEYKLDIDF